MTELPIDETNQQDTKPAEVIIDDSNKPKGSKRAKLSAPLIAAVVLLIGGGVAAFVVSAQNSPEKIWAKALQTTAAGLDEFTKKIDSSNDKSASIDGNFKISSPIAVEGTIEGKGSATDVELKGMLAYSGLRFDAEVIATSESEIANPDVYFKVGGIEGIGNLLGGFGTDSALTQSLNDLNDQWYVIDSTFFDQQNAGLDQDLVEQFSAEDLTDLFKTSAGVVSDRLLTSEKDRAVFVIDESFGKEEFAGADTHKYRIAVDKDNTKEFVKEYVEAVKDNNHVELLQDSFATGFTEAGGSGSGLDDISVEKFLEQVDELDFSDANAEVWVDAKRKFIRNVRIDLNPIEGSAYIDFSLPYDGGDELPFTMTIVGMDESSEGTLTFEIIYSQSSEDLEFKFDIDVDVLEGSMSDIRAEGSLSVKGSEEGFRATPPDDAKNLLELVSSFGLDSLFTPVVPDPSGLDALFDLQSLPLDDVEL